MCEIPEASPLSFIADVAPAVDAELAKDLSCLVGFQYHESIKRWSAQLGTRYLFLSSAIVDKLLYEMEALGLKFYSGLSLQKANSLLKHEIQKP